jgi:hypothetical protein
MRTIREQRTANALSTEPVYAIPMTQYFHSGTPKNDAFQWLENKCTDYRLFSIYGDYRKPVMRWLRDVKDGIDSLDAFLDRYPIERIRIERADTLRRHHQLEQCDARDFDTPEVLRSVEMAAIYPRTIMLDSGAFSVWRSGGKITVDEVISAYSAFLVEAGDLFNQVWLINLDEIPGKPGLPVQDERTLKDAAEVEDRNLVILREALARFDPHILPVIHQSRNDAFDRERLKVVLEQAAHSDHFLCVSPDNSRPEKERVEWAQAIRDLAHEIAPDVRLHGLATTGNVMANGFGFYSVDSIAWYQHALYGTLDLYEKDGAEYRYRGYHVSVERDAFDLATRKRVPWRKANYSNYTAEECASIQARCERYTFPFEMVQWSARARSLINMGELGCFLWAHGERDLAEAA